MCVCGRSASQGRTQGRGLTRSGADRKNGYIGWSGGTQFFRPWLHSRTLPIFVYKIRTRPFMHRFLLQVIPITKFGQNVLILCAVNCGDMVFLNLWNYDSWNIFIFWPGQGFLLRMLLVESTLDFFRVKFAIAILNILERVSKLFFSDFCI